MQRTCSVRWPPRLLACMCCSACDAPPRLVLTPLILAQPEEVVPTAAASEQNGLEGGWEGVEAMEMVR